MKYLKYKIKKYIHQLSHKPSIYKVFALSVIGGNVEIKEGDHHKIDVRGIINLNGSQSTIYYPWQDLSYEIKGDKILSLFEHGWFQALGVGKTVIEVTSKIDPLLSVEFKIEVIERE